MGYYNGSGKGVTSPFKTTGQYPLDLRTVVSFHSDLYDSHLWNKYNKAGTEIIEWHAYEGLLVTVLNLDPNLDPYELEIIPEKIELYMCLDSFHVENENSWRKVSPSEIQWNDEIESIQSESEETPEENEGSQETEEPLENTDSLNSDGPNSGD